jgi:protein-serine/threonine kinase
MGRTVAQELPWRAARGSDATFAAYCERYEGSMAPSPLNSLTPKECRTLLKKMLAPSPKARIMVEQVVEVRSRLLPLLLPGRS